MKIISPLRRWHVLAGLCKSIEATRLVEIGCKEGLTTGFLLDELPQLHVTAIDPWCGAPNEVENYEHWDWSKIELMFVDRIRAHIERCSMLQMTSLEACTRVPDASVDIVFIDAAHDYDNVLADILAWWPKVRDGGYLALHDYQHKFPGVHRAVAKCFPLLRVAIMPDSIACIQKDSTLRLAA